MRWTAGFAMALASVALLGACGNTGRRSSPVSRPNGRADVAATATTPEYARVDRDKDNDVEAAPDDTTHKVVHYGHEASEPERRTIVALIRRYYGAALAGDGAQACSMLYSLFAESTPEDYGSADKQPGLPYMKGNTCPAVLNGLFRHDRVQLMAEVPLLQVTHVRMVEHRAKVLLRFGKLAEREIPVLREGHTWRVDALLDGELL